MQIRRGFAAVLIIGLVAAVLLVTVGVGLYVNKVKNDQTLGYKTQKKPKLTVKAKPTYSQLGLSKSDSLSDIDADLKIINFDGIDASLSEVSAEIK